MTQAAWIARAAVIESEPQMRAHSDQAGQAATGQAPSGAPAVPVGLLGAAQERVAPGPLETEPDRRLADLREHLQEIGRRATGATSWLESSEHYARLLNAEGFVPVTARFDTRDLKFLGRAREDLIAFAELGTRVADLHRPLDGGGASSDPARPVLRCRNCMWRWPCPTFRLLMELLGPR